MLHEYKSSRQSGSHSKSYQRDSDRDRRSSEERERQERERERDRRHQSSYRSRSRSPSPRGPSKPTGSKSPSREPQHHATPPQTSRALEQRPSGKGSATSAPEQSTQLQGGDGDKRMAELRKQFLNLCFHGQCFPLNLRHIPSDALPQSGFK